jgi:hypothetical protein
MFPYIVGDCMAHVTSTFYAFIQYIKLLNSNMKEISYFSDGDASQYKNRKNVANLVTRKKVSGIAAQWHFFVTSHGKGPCHAAGETTKWHAVRVSLQCPYDKQIPATKDFFEFAYHNIQGIKYFYASHVDITANFFSTLMISNWHPKTSLN